MISFELAAIFAQLNLPESRAAGARALAAWCGAREVLLLGKDAEIGLFLPAPGLPQTLRDGGSWQAFLGSCPGGCVSMPDPRGAGEVASWCFADPAGLAVLVFLGTCPEAAQAAAIRALLPLLGSKLAIERRTLSAEAHVAAAREGNRRAGALNTALDINRRELQQACKMAERELESRREAERKLRDADRRKDEFLAMLAHELRNPLAPISMAAQILRIDPTNPARLRQTCQIIDRQVTHMTSLLDDLLDVSRVTGGMVALTQELHDMRRIVDDALEQARPLINSREHHLTLNLEQDHVPVCGDSTRLVQIVTNLLNNAAKYTPTGGDIAVRLALRAEEIVLTVRDNGIGIDAALLPHVFDLFTQGERSADRAQGGLGLGLALVKNLAERHGGTVEARSEGAGRGSEFEVVLPLAQAGALPQAPGAAAHPAAARAAGPHSILIVDDNADAAHTLSLYLQAQGHRVTVAASAAEGLGLAARRAPQVLLLDIGLPDMDGYALARRLRALPALDGALFIALTGYGRPEDRANARAAGFDHHLTKPVAAAELARLLGSVRPPPAR